MWRGKQKREGRDEVEGVAERVSLPFKRKKGTLDCCPFFLHPILASFARTLISAIALSTPAPPRPADPLPPCPSPTPHPTPTPYPHSTMPSTFYPTTTTPGNILTVEVCRGLDSLFDRQHSPPVQLPKGAGTQLNVINIKEMVYL